ncbi:MAG: hypothetical protein NTU88_16375 [Armatimonadetes bacterium]|nr:hypothetical protein [Armatimonadota bacterium]
MKRPDGELIANAGQTFRVLGVLSFAVSIRKFLKDHKVLLALPERCNI